MKIDARVFIKLAAATLAFPISLLAQAAPQAVASAQSTAQPPAAFVPITQAVAAELSGARALSTVSFVEQFFRLPGNRGFDAALDTVAALLEQAGYVLESKASAATRLVYRMESRPMRAAAWTPDSASLTLGGRSQPLLRWATNHNMLAINSESTAPAGIDAEVVNIGDGADSMFLKTDVKGKIVFTTGAARTVFPRAMQRGAVGLLATQKLPAYNKPSQNVHAIGFSAVPRDTITKGWVIFLSTAARDSVRAFLASTQRPQVHVAVAARFENRPERTLVAEVRGRSAPAERFVYSAHVQEPGANDNASGVGLLAEMARVTAHLLQQRRADPARTITFLWGDEISSTRRFLQEDSVRRAGVRWACRSTWWVRTRHSPVARFSSRRCRIRPQCGYAARTSIASGVAARSMSPPSVRISSTTSRDSVASIEQRQRAGWSSRTRSRVEVTTRHSSMPKFRRFSSGISPTSSTTPIAIVSKW